MVHEEEIAEGEGAIGTYIPLLYLIRHCNIVFMITD